MSEKIIAFANLNGNSLKTTSESVKNLSCGKNIIIDKQNVCVLSYGKPFSI